MSKKVFLCWSGNRSKIVSTRLRDWLPTVLPVEPWMSDVDLGAGRPWTSELTKALSDCSCAVLCLTAENMAAPWILFEAGAIAGAVGWVIPFLLGTGPEGLPTPLSQFQAVAGDKNGTLRLLKSINEELGEDALRLDQLGKVFEKEWFALESELSEPVVGLRLISDLEDTWTIARQMVREVPQGGFIFDSTSVKNEREYEALVHERAMDEIEVIRIVATDQVDASIKDFIRPPWDYGGDEANKVKVQILHYPHPIPFDILAVRYNTVIKAMVGFKSSARHTLGPQYHSALHVFSPESASALCHTYDHVLVPVSHPVEGPKTGCAFCDKNAPK